MGEHENSMREFSELKNWTIGKTEKFGCYFAVYTSIVNSPKQTIFALLGLVGSLAYLNLLCRNIEDLKATDLTPMLNKLEIRETKLRRISLICCAYSFAFQTRLLIPVIMALSCW